MKISLYIKAPVCHSVSHSIPESSQLSLQMFITVNHWSGWRPLASAALSILAPPWDSSQIACCCPVSWTSGSFGSAGPAPSHDPADDADAGQGGPTQSPGWYLSWSAHLFSCSRASQGELSTHCGALGAGSTVLPRQGSSYSPKRYNLQGAGLLLLHPSHHIAGESQGQLSRAHG